MSVITRWLTARNVRARNRNELHALGISDADIDQLTEEELRPLTFDFDAVSEVAKVGTRLDEIADHVDAAYRVAIDARMSTMTAVYCVARLNVWGVPHQHAATIIIDIARSAREEA